MKATATLVQEDQRWQFLPMVFGNAMLRAEALLFSYAESMSPDDYKYGSWNYYKIGNCSGYAAPARPERFRVCVFSNGFDGTMSNDAAGIVFTLFVLGQLAQEAVRYNDELMDMLVDHYDELRAYAMEHAEAQAISGALD